MKKFWYVYRVFGGSPTYRHDSYESAEVEARRLCERVGGEFLILEAVSSVQPAPKTVTTVFGAARDEPMPF